MKTDKPMKWKRIIRASGLIEWVCEHGVGHPDDASIEAMNAKMERYLMTYHPEDIRLDRDYGYGVHGCDGCCSRDDFPGKKA